MSKRSDSNISGSPPQKKQKTGKLDKSGTGENTSKTFHKKSHGNEEKKIKTFQKKSYGNGKKPIQPLLEKPEDWNEFKKKKKELRQKRRQGKEKFEEIVEAKKIGEKLRCKTLKGGPEERNKLINELHLLLKGQELYAKFVLAHDTSRIVQWLLKYASAILKDQISKELLPVTVQMFQSKYAVFCVKRLMKYGSQETKLAIVNAVYGNVVKLACNRVSAAALEYAWLNCASPLQKQHLCQEFCGDLYKSSKDDNVKHLRDTYTKSPELKAAILRATKDNLTKVINKGMVDSGIFQTVLNQYFSECILEEKIYFIPFLIPHLVVISNSKDGVRVAMQCIWHGTNKERKSAMKTLKENVVSLCEHEHGHCIVITLLDAIDDTVLLQKLLLTEILKNANQLAESSWGRKVLLWLVAPADPMYFHPIFVKELEEGRKASTSKKSVEVRRKEILEHSSKTLMNLVKENPEFWLKSSSLAYEMLAIIKSGSGDEVKDVFNSIVNVIVDPNWSIQIDNKTELGVENAGLHMVLKKMLKTQRDFVVCLVEALKEETLDVWLSINRGCFLLVNAWENGTENTQEILKTKLKTHKKMLKKKDNKGANILYSFLEK